MQLLLGALVKQGTCTLQLLLGALVKQGTCTLQLLLGAPFATEYTTYTL